MRQTHFAQVIHPEDLHLIQDGFDRAMAGDAAAGRGTGRACRRRDRRRPVHGDPGHRRGRGRRRARDHRGRHRGQAGAARARGGQRRQDALPGHHRATRCGRRWPRSSALRAADRTPTCRPSPSTTPASCTAPANAWCTWSTTSSSSPGSRRARSSCTRGPFDVLAMVDDVAVVGGAAGREPRPRRSPSTSTSPSRRPCLGDARRITQVLTSLVQNALAFTERGSVDVRVSARGAAPNPDGTASGDTWVDFTRQRHRHRHRRGAPHRLFEPVRPGRPAVPARDRRGVGLGLAICRELVDLMGGRLTVCSTLGQGSTFSFGVALARA